MGGTWDLFRYPGIRSDSDMYTLGYRFRPWRDAKAIADGPAIKRYIAEHNRRARPFVWTKPAAGILAAVSRSPEPSV